MTVMWLVLVLTCVAMLACLRYVDVLLAIVRDRDFEIDELEARADEYLEDLEMYSRWVTVLLSENERLRTEASA